MICRSTTSAPSWPPCTVRSQHVIESEALKSADNDDFSIGRVVALDEEAVLILNFDPLGVWDDEPCVIDYDEITKIQFDSPYLSTMSKYFKGPTRG
jgi:hypothetical protein